VNAAHTLKLLPCEFLLRIFVPLESQQRFQSLAKHMRSLEPVHNLRALPVPLIDNQSAGWYPRRRSRMFVADRSEFSSVSAACSLPHDSPRPAIVISGSRSLQPKLLPPFPSHCHATRALLPQLPAFVRKTDFCVKPRKISTSTKRACNARGICKGLKAGQNQHLRKKVGVGRKSIRAKAHQLLVSNRGALPGCR
jgi:hypothetical protein